MLKFRFESYILKNLWKKYKQVKSNIIYHSREIRAAEREAYGLSKKINILKKHN
jgi:hypothetical protein